MRVSDVMSGHPAVCTVSSSAQTAAALMKEHDTGILPVVDDTYSRRLVGVVTDRDLCLTVVAAGRDPKRTWIEDCMTRDPIFCTAADKAETALEIMQRHQVRRVPVVDTDKTVQGMVSLSDLVRRNAVANGELFTALKRIFASKGRTKKAA